MKRTAVVFLAACIGVMATAGLLGRISDIEYQVDVQQQQIEDQGARNTDLYNMIATVRNQQLADEAATSASVTQVPQHITVDNLPCPGGYQFC